MSLRPRTTVISGVLSLVRVVEINYRQLWNYDTFTGNNTLTASTHYDNFLLQNTWFLQSWQQLPSWSSMCILESNLVNLLAGAFQEWSMNTST